MFLCFNLNSKNTYSNYKDPIWADAAGYYIYLPATFIYGWDQQAIPADWPEKLGDGFEFTAEGKLKTKYHVGVAILESPFFLIGHVFAKNNGHGDGYSYEYHWALWMSGVFYLVAGLFFLKEYLRRRYELRYVLITLLSLLIGTNLYYYALNSPGMSHIYSFFLFSLLLWLADRVVNKTKPKHVLLFSFFSALALLVRPTNGLFVLFLFALHPSLFRMMIGTIRKPLLFAGALMLVLLALLPQFIYWHYLSGSYLHYSYEGEGFNWFNPQLIEFWFSTNNGLFTYSPILIFALIGMAMMWKRKRRSTLIFAAMFLVISYVFSAWWCWWYGCSYGSRNFVEFLVPLSIPFCLFVEQTFGPGKASVKYLFITLAGLCIFVNLKMIYKYDDCFHGGIWDWNAFYKLIF